ncbi:MAG: VCBS repeat-containing protein, partial [Bacteroidales bacterium]
MLPKLRFGFLYAILFLSFILCPKNLWAKEVFPFSVAYPILKSAPVVFFPYLQNLINPWVGGLNACHFAQMDLNGDGKDEMLVFDRVGSCLLTFNSQGIYAPEYKKLLPPIQAWFQLYDYNADGLMDVFTFNGISGISVYKNVSLGSSKTNFSLRFEKISEALPTKMLGQMSPLYCTNVDYPAFVDIDADGDMDILNFWVPSTGDFLQYYRNFSIEKYGKADSLCFEMEDNSWGCFVESEESNQVYLDSCNPLSVSYSWQSMLEKSKQDPKHSGSTLKALKRPNSEVFDLLIGDVGFPDLFYLKNGGSLQKAHIVSYDSNFPAGKDAACLYNFPVVSTLKFHDTLSYIVSPFSTDAFQTAGSQSVWRYSVPPSLAKTTTENAQNGYNEISFSLEEKDFLQNTMLDFGSGAVPVLYDYNKDGLMDIVVGNYGTIDSTYFYYGSWEMVQYGSLSLLQNVGTKENPAFELKTRDFLGLKADLGLRQRALYPAFGDINGDGREEMLLGLENGRIFLFNIEKDKTNHDILKACLIDTLFSGIQLSGFASPVLFDLNRDGRLDLIVGEKQHVWKSFPRNITKGSLSYYKNTGKSDLFRLETDSLGGVDVIDRSYSNFGYSRPFFYRGDRSETWLLCGSENGQIFLYGNIADHIDGTFPFLGPLSVWDGQEK